MSSTCVLASVALFMVVSTPSGELRHVYGGVYMVGEHNEGYFYPTWMIMWLQDWSSITLDNMQFQLVNCASMPCGCVHRDMQRSGVFLKIWVIKGLFKSKCVYDTFSQSTHKSLIFGFVSKSKYNSISFPNQWMN
jgi:hypothetical protein